MAQNAIANATYVDHVERWLARVGRDRCRIYLFEDLATDGRAFIQRIATDIGLDPGHYEDYAFPLENQTYVPRSTALQRFNIAVRRYLPKGRVYNATRAIYRRLNTCTPGPASEHDQALVAELRRSFRDANARLAERCALDLSRWDAE